MLGSSKESRNMQALNFTTSWNRLALPVNPECQQPIKYFPVFTWNILENRRSAEASTSRQLVWLKAVQERKGGSSLRRGVEHVTLEFPALSETHHCRRCSRLWGYLSPFLLPARSHSSAGRQAGSLRTLPQATQSRSTYWAQFTFQVTRTSWES